MSQLVRLRGKHTAQCTHCAMCIGEALQHQANFLSASNVEEGSLWCETQKGNFQGVLTKFSEVTPPQ